MLGIGASRDLPTVLIIDDDMVSREVMATVLTMTGYTIHTAAQGDDAIAMLDAGTCNPEVILMDAQMPGLNGVRLVEELRARTQGKHLRYERQRCRRGDQESSSTGIYPSHSVPRHCSN